MNLEVGNIILSVDKAYIGYVRRMLPHPKKKFNILEIWWSNSNSADRWMIREVENNIEMGLWILIK